jgi:hypothetical protein
MTGIARLTACASVSLPLISAAAVSNPKSQLDGIKALQGRKAPLLLTAQDLSTLSGSAEQCSRILALGPQYAPRASVCEFVLSPRNMPNYVCDQSAQRFVNDRPLDVVTAEVKFLSDGGHYTDHYSDFKIDGEPLQSRASSPAASGQISTGASSPPSSCPPRPPSLHSRRS